MFAATVYELTKAFTLVIVLRSVGFSWLKQAFGWLRLL